MFFSIGGEKSVVKEGYLTTPNRKTTWTTGSNDNTYWNHIQHQIWPPEEISEHDLISSEKNMPQISINHIDG